MPVLARTVFARKYGVSETLTSRLQCRRDRAARRGGRILQRTGCLGPLSCETAGRVKMNIGNYQVYT